LSGSNDFAPTYL